MLDWQLSFLYYMLFHPNKQEKYEMKKVACKSQPRLMGAKTPLRPSYQVLWSLT